MSGRTSFAWRDAMKRVGTAAGYLVGWIVAFVASSAATYQLSFLINKFGPSCRGGGPHHIPAWTCGSSRSPALSQRRSL
jgi:hypothetical protein